MNVMITVKVLFLILVSAFLLSAQTADAGGGIVTGTSGMLSDVGSDFFTDASAVEAAGSPDGDETPTDTDQPGDVDTTDSEPADTTEPEPEPEPEDTEEPTTEEVPVAAKATEQDSTLPEGVRKIKDRSGKEGLFVEPTAWENIHGNHQLVQQASDLLMEPLTIDAIDLRERAYQGQERMYSDFLSGDPKAAQRFISDFAQTAKDALASGEIGTDPFVPFATELYTSLQQVSPDAYASLRQQAATDLVNEMYAEAAQTQNPNLFHSAGHIAKTLGLPFKPSADMQQFFAQKGAPADPSAALRAENQTLKDQLAGRHANDAETQFKQFVSNTSRGIESSVLSDAIMPALDGVKAEWAKLPGGERAFNDLVVARMVTQVYDSIGGDKKFLSSIGLIDQNAKRAVNAQAREQFGKQIQQLYVNKAKLVVGAIKGDITKFAASKLVEQNQQTHQRRATAQTQRGPKGATSPVQKSLVPGATSTGKAGTMFNPTLAARETADLISQM